MSNTLYWFTEKFSLLNRYSNHHSYLRLFKGINYKLKLWVILKHSSHAETFADLKRIFGEYGITISYGVCNEIEVIKVDDRKNIIWHEVSGKGMYKHVTRRSHRSDLLPF